MSQEGDRFKNSEAEISRADFGQVATPAQACQGKRRISPCRYDQVESGRQMVNEKGNGPVVWRVSRTGALVRP